MLFLQCGFVQPVHFRSAHAREVANGKMAAHVRINLLIRPLFGTIQVAASVGPSDYLTDTLFEHRLAVVSQPACSHRSLDLDDLACTVSIDVGANVSRAW